MVGHRIIELETSRKIAAAAAAGQAGRHMAQDPPTPSHPRQHLASDFAGRDRSMPVGEARAPPGARRQRSCCVAGLRFCRIFAPFMESSRTRRGVVGGL